MSSFDRGLLVWWLGLSAVAALNVGLWLWSLRIVLRRSVGQAALSQYRRCHSPRPGEETWKTH